MAKGRTAGGQRGSGKTVANRVLESLCWAVPIGIAAKMNLEALQNGTTATISFSIASVVLGAVCIQEAFGGTGLTKRLTAALIACFLLVLNFSNALSNLAAHSDSSRDSSTQLQQTVTLKRQRLSQTLTDRHGVADKAGTATPESIEADIQSAKSADANRWKSTEGCNPEKITAGQSRAFCSNIANLESKLAAAKRRDALDVVATKLEDELKDLRAPSSVDSFADEVAGVLAMAGYEASKELISRLRVWAQALGVEIIGEFGPAILLGLLHRIMAIRPVEAGGGQGIPRPRPAQDAGGAKEETAAEEDLLGRFLADSVEFVEGCEVEATPLFRAWEAWCSRHAIPSGTQTAFGRKAGTRLMRTESNGKRRYMGVRLRETGKPSLKIVS